MTARAAIVAFVAVLGVISLPAAAAIGALLIWQSGARDV